MSATTTATPGRTDDRGTTLHPQRIAVRFPLRTPLDDLEPVLQVLHRCIQRGWLEGALLDVADYRHVPAGPGVMLVAHDVDYSVAGDALTLTRKRSHGDDLATQLTDLLRMAAVLVEAFAYDGSVEVDAQLSRAVVTLLDRRLAGSLDEPVAALADGVAGALQLLDDVEVAGVAADDPRAPAAVEVTTAVVPAAELVELLGGSRATGQSPYDVPVEQLAAALEDDDVLVLDVREPNELETASLGGTNVPLAQLEERLGELDRDRRILVHCRAGLRGAKAVQLLRDNGFDDAWNVNGALVAWADRIDPAFPRY